MSTATAAARRPRWWAPEVVQTSSMDCGPAALKCVLEGFHIPVSYGRLREACQTSVDGTSIDTLEVVAGQLGLQAEQVLVPADHLALPAAGLLPAIAVVRHADGATHFVVVWRRIGPWLQIMDPAQGRRWVHHVAFRDELFHHEMPVAAPDWRTWAGSDAFLRPLQARLQLLGASAADAARLVSRAVADPLWFGPGALDAAVRFVQSVVRAGGMAPGRAALDLAQLLFAQTHTSTDDIFKTIPRAYWSVIPAGTEDGVLQLSLRGAVLLHLAARAPGALAGSGAAPDDADAEPAPALPRELQAALQEKPVHPLRTVWGLLREDGLLGPLALAGAMALAAGVVLVELMLFRGLFDIAASLALPAQRLLALAALAALVALLMLVEVPIVTESMRMGRHLELRLRALLLERLPRLHDRYFQSRPVSDMAERSHSIHLARLVPGFGLQFVQILCDLGFTLLGIWLIDGASLGLALLVVLAAIALPALLQSPMNERDLRARNHGGALHVFNLDALLGLVPIRTHSAARAVQRQHEALLVQWARASRSLVQLALGARALQALVGLLLVATLLFQHFQRADGASGADLLLVYWALKLPALGQALMGLAQQYPAQRNVLLRMLEPLSAAQELRAEAQAPAPLPASDRLVPTGASISLQGGRVLAGGHPVLQDVDLHIGAGEHVAVVGASGAGKSTLVGLLLGWHRLAEGELRVNGAPLTEQAQETLRRQVAWVDPGIQIWNRSLLDNLQYASGPAQAGGTAAVLDAADLRQVLQKLPDGLQSLLGESGALLSGGEGQRVRLARALLQPDVQLVLLDEPFRGLDRAQRIRLLAQARSWWQSRTLVCITHDVTETRDFTRVLVLDEGRIVEDGHPAQLAAGDTHYRALLDAEARLRDGLWQDPVWRRIRVADGQVSEAPRPAHAGLPGTEPA